MSKKKFNIGEIEIGADQLFLISGPCVIEDEKIMMDTAEELNDIRAFNAPEQKQTGGGDSEGNSHLSIWNDYDFFFVHFKYTDSTGEDGDFDKKVHIIGDLDALLPRLMKLNPDVVVVSADHSTPSTMASHSWHPLPTLIWGKNCRRDSTASYGETAAIVGGLGQFKAVEQMPLAMANAGKLLKYGA